MEAKDKPMEEEAMEETRAVSGHHGCYEGAYIGKQGCQGEDP